MAKIAKGESKAYCQICAVRIFRDDHVFILTCEYKLFRHLIIQFQVRNAQLAFRNMLACVIKRYGVMLTAPAKALSREHPGEGDESNQSRSQTN